MRSVGALKTEDIIVTTSISASGPNNTCGRLGEGLCKVAQIHPGEGKALAWSWLYVFALFLAYYILRPIREELGVAGGVNNLPWLFRDVDRYDCD